MYKVFINDSVICFTNNSEKSALAINCVELNFFSEHISKFVYEIMCADKQLKKLYVVVKEPDVAFNQFKKQFKFINAAGGIVENKEGKRLFIYRLGKWDLPKGKIETGENTEEAALREVEEECGVKDLQITSELAPTFHLYEKKKGVYLKQTHWFHMKTDFAGPLTPQIEESITKVEWLTENEVKTKVLKNTYASISDLLG